MSNIPYKISGNGKNDFTLNIEGREIPVLNARYIRTMDTIADAVSCTFPWFPGHDNFIDAVTRPFAYTQCGIYIGNDLQMKGILYNVRQRIDSNGRVKDLEIWTKTANVVDSSNRYPFEENNLDLFERIESQMNSTVTGRNMEIQTIIDDGVNIGGKFKRVSVSETGNLFESLKKLAAQRGCLLSNTIDGDILITKAKLNSKPVGTIEEGSAFTENFSVKFDGRKRYQEYAAIATSASKTRSRKRQTDSDDVVTTPRFLTFNTDDGLPGEAVNAAIWRKNKSAAEAMSFQVPVNTWYAPDGNLWRENTLLTVKSETMSIPDGFTFLITRVEFIFEENGVSANLDVKPPSLYSTGEIEEPWTT